MSLSLIHRPTGQAADAQRLGPYRIETLIRPQEEGGGTAYRVRIEPHQRTTVSYHKIAEEFYYVLSGRGIALLNDEPHALEPGDFLRLPPGTTHGFITDEEPLEMLNIHTPGSRPDRDVYFTGPTPEGFSRRPSP